MAVKNKINNRSNVDKGLVAMFLKMSPGERLLATDNAASAIVELRNAFRQQQADKRESQTTAPIAWKTITGTLKILLKIYNKTIKLNSCIIDNIW